MALRNDSDKQVNRKRFWNRVTVLSFLALAVLIILIEFPGPASCSTTPATYYVLPGGNGTGDGLTWTNAACRIPSSLAAGDVVYIGNVVGKDMANTSVTACAEASHTFSSSGTSGSHITIKAATAADHGPAAGWSASYGVDVSPAITWSNNAVPGGGLTLPFWKVCGNYYDFLGQVGSTGNGTAQPTKKSFGFYLKSAGQMFGHIMFDPAQCSSGPLQNLNIQQIEIDGVEANSYNCHTGNCSAVDSGAGGFYVGGGTNVVSNITVNQMYMHDISGMVAGAGPVTSLTVTNSYFDTNFSCGASPTPCNQHSNAFDINTPVTQGFLNLTIANSVFRNIQGTGIITALNGVNDGWKVYNNIFFYSSDWNTVCQHGLDSATCGIKQAIGDNAAGSALTNGVFYGNMFFGIHLYNTGQGGADTANFYVEQAASTGNIVENNIWFNNTRSSIITSAAAVRHDYNLFLNTQTLLCPGNICQDAINSHEYNTSSGTVNPFVSSSTGNFQLASAGSNTPSGCTAGTNCYANGLALASPYNVDFVGATRGGANGWTRGAYQYGSGSTSATATGPNPPSSLIATVQ